MLNGSEKKMIKEKTLETVYEIINQKDEKPEINVKLLKYNKPSITFNPAQQQLKNECGSAKLILKGNNINSIKFNIEVSPEGNICIINRSDFLENLQKVKKFWLKCSVCKSQIPSLLVFDQGPKKYIKMVKTGYGEKIRFVPLNDFDKELEKAVLNARNRITEEKTENIENLIEEPDIKDLLKSSILGKFNLCQKCQTKILQEMDNGTLTLEKIVRLFPEFNKNTISKTEDLWKEIKNLPIKVERC